MQNFVALFSSSVDDIIKTNQKRSIIMTYEEKKQKKVEIFEDTERLYTTIDEFADYIKDTIACTKFYPANCSLPPARQLDTPASINVTKSKSLQAAYNYLEKFPETKVCVHNFASATHPGGGVRWGSSAQEECLCRCTTLYPCLNTSDLFKKYYAFHRNRHDTYYTDAIIYTPNVVALKTDDDFPVRLPNNKWYKLDVITCAAPNLRDSVLNKESYKDFIELHRKRAEKIILVAAENGADVLIAGAFGCGAFKNPPQLVAQAWKQAIAQHRKALKHIEFAVYCTPRDEKNYWAFKGEMAR